MQRLLSVLLLLSLHACSDKREQLLCRTWEVSDVRFLNEKQSLVVSDTMKGNQQEVAKSILREILMKNVYSFSSDGSYRTGNASASANGKWKLSGNAIRFISESSSEKKEKLVPIESLNEDSLVLLMQKDQTSVNIRLVLTPVEK